MEFVKKHGLGWVTLAVIVLYLYWENKKLFAKIEDRMQKEIDKLADDNRRYREVYLIQVQGLAESTVKRLHPPDDGKKSRKR